MADQQLSIILKKSIKLLKAVGENGGTSFSEAFCKMGGQKEEALLT